jgi:hypothetical protein
LVVQYKARVHPSSCISAAGTPQRGTELGGGPCLENSFEAGKSTGHSATHESQLVLDGMIVFISTSCLQHEKGYMDAKFSKLNLSLSQGQRAQGFE